MKTFCRMVRRRCTRNMRLSALSTVSISITEVTTKPAMPIAVRRAAFCEKELTCSTTESDVSGGTVAAALEAVFRAQPQVRGYVLDEQGELRKHVFIFVDGRRAGLGDAVRGESAIHVMQALTGG